MNAKRSPQPEGWGPDGRPDNPCQEQASPQDDYSTDELTPQEVELVLGMRAVIAEDPENGPLQMLDLAHEAQRLELREKQESEYAALLAGQERQAAVWAARRVFWKAWQGQ